MHLPTVVKPIFYKTAACVFFLENNPTVSNVTELCNGTFINEDDEMSIEGRPKKIENLSRSEGELVTNRNMCRDIISGRRLSCSIDKQVVYECGCIGQIGAARS